MLQFAALQLSGVSLVGLLTMTVALELLLAVTAPSPAVAAAPPQSRAESQAPSHATDASGYSHTLISRTEIKGICLWPMTSRLAGLVIKKSVTEHPGNMHMTMSLIKIVAVLLLSLSGAG